MLTKNDMSVISRVEKIRVAKKVTKTNMAEALNLSLQGYRHIANGSVRLCVDRLRKIAEVLEVSPAVFFDDKLTDSVIKNNLLLPTGSEGR